MQSNPETYNKFRTDQIMREAACKAAQQAMKVLEDASTTTAPQYDKLAALGTFIRGCAEGMLWDEDNSSSYDD